MSLAVAFMITRARGISARGENIKRAIRRLGKEDEEEREEGSFG